MSDPALYYAVGTSIANMVTFDLLGIVAPFQDAYVPFTVEAPAHDALVYGHGFDLKQLSCVGGSSLRHRETRSRAIALESLPLCMYVSVMMIGNGCTSKPT